MRILGATCELDDFLREWKSPGDTIVAHTSGSTGRPKDIRLMKADMLRSARATISTLRLTDGGLFVSPLSADYIAGKMMVVRAIVADADLLFLQPKRSPLEGYRLDRRISLLPIVPAQIDALLDDPKFGLVDTLIIGGAPVPPDREARLVETGVKAFATYGMTETCSHVALRRLGDDVFSAVDGVTFDVTDDSRLVVNWTSRLETNDVVELISPTSFRWKGRADNVINSGGIKIHPEELEREISKVVSEPFYVVGRPSYIWGEEAVLVVEGKGDETALLSEIKQLLPPKKSPKAVIFKEKLDRTPSGKILRQRPI